MNTEGSGRGQRGLVLGLNLESGGRGAVRSRQAGLSHLGSEFVLKVR